MGYAFTDSSLKAQSIKATFLAIARFVFKKTTICVLNSEDKHLIETNKIAQKVILLPGEGINTQRLQAHPEPNNGVFQISYVGRLLKDKGIYEVVSLAQKLKEKNIKLQINFYGDIDSQNPNSLSQDEVASLKLNCSLKFHGYTTDIEKVWAQSNMAILFSYREGLPQSLIEAALCKRSIVASNIPACREIIDHKINGLLVDIHNLDVEIDSIASIINNSDLRKEYSEKLYQKVSSKFSSAAVADQIKALLNI